MYYAVSGENSSPSELDDSGSLIICLGIDFCALQEFCGVVDVDSVIEAAEVDGESPTSSLVCPTQSALYAHFGALSGMGSCDGVFSTLCLAENCWSVFFFALRLSAFFTSKSSSVNNNHHSMHAYLHTGKVMITNFCLLKSWLKCMIA